jgi:hypothetical protein
MVLASTSTLIPFLIRPTSPVVPRGYRPPLRLIMNFGRRLADFTNVALAATSMRSPVAAKLVQYENNISAIL